MVWIKTHTGDGILNDNTIERICSEPPRNLNKSFEFYAFVNQKSWLIYAVNVPREISNLAKDKTITEELHPKIMDMEDKILEKLMSFILKAKEDEVIDLSEKFSQSNFFKK